MGTKENRLSWLKSICDGATEGPWYPGCNWIGGIYKEKALINQLGVVGKNSFIDDENGKNDAKFIATARTAMPLLIEIIEKQREALDLVSDDFDKIIMDNIRGQLAIHAGNCKSKVDLVLTETANLLEKLNEGEQND